LCHCNGDIDDIEWGDASEEAMHCSHSTRPDCQCYEDDYEDEDEWPWEEIDEEG